jgi:hypothetical protein
MRAPLRKSFLVLFSKKNLLACCPLSEYPAGRTGPGPVLRQINDTRPHAT